MDDNKKISNEALEYLSGRIIKMARAYPGTGGLVIKLKDLQRILQKMKVDSEDE